MTANRGLSATENQWKLASTEESLRGFLHCADDASDSWSMRIIAKNHPTSLSSQTLCWGFLLPDGIDTFTHVERRNDTARDNILIDERQAMLDSLLDSTHDSWFIASKRRAMLDSFAWLHSRFVAGKGAISYTFCYVLCLPYRRDILQVRHETAENIQRMPVSKILKIWK